MISVIADDLTGAAEVAGLALSFGLRAAVLVDCVREIDVDVLVVATNMRSSDRDSAECKSEKIAKALLGLNCKFIYKKTDSVLRGHIGAELMAQMRSESKSIALLVPANPTHNRTIRNGIYYVDGVELGQTPFGVETECSGNSSSVTSRLECQGVEVVRSVDVDDSIEKPGIYIGNVSSAADLRTWASTVQDQWVPAGGADFFSALLVAQGFKLSNAKGSAPCNDSSHSTLLVCGSRYPESREFVKTAREAGVSCAPMPDSLYYDSVIDERKVAGWAQQVIEILAAGGPVIVGAFQDKSDSGLDGQLVAAATGKMVAQVNAAGAVRHLMLEGGATAQAVISQLALEELSPRASLAPGVTQFVVNHCDGLCITMKPGSYAWPIKAWPAGSPLYK